MFILEQIQVCYQSPNEGKFQRLKETISQEGRS